MKIMIFLISGIVGIGLIVALITMGGLTFHFLRPKLKTLPEFYMELGMQRTPELEAQPEIRNALADLKAAGVCGINYHVRISQTYIEPKMIQDCETKDWIIINRWIEGVTQPPYAPYGIKKFAVLSREDGLIVVSGGARGVNTLQELTAGIPKIIADIVRLVPEIRQARAVKNANEALQAEEQKKREEEIRKSFGR